ncbi:MAG: hypothetical protein OXE87_07300 [Chloroflexi bacterium]|nr:hypothetical protein [Chloroflexota bacterium]
MAQPEPYADPLDTAELVDEFLVDEFLADCAGLSTSTRSNYRWALDRLIAHCPTLPQTRRELAPVFETPKANGDPLQTESKRQLRKVLRIFHAWCMDDYDVANAAAGLRAIPPDAPPIRWLRDHEIDRLLQEAGGKSRSVATSRNCYASRSRATSSGHRCAAVVSRAAGPGASCPG